MRLLFKGVDFMGEYSLERTVEFSNMVARIYRPELTEEEKNRRMQKIKNASANLLKEVRRK